MSEMERSFAALSERLLAVDKALTHTKDEVLDQEKRVFASLESAARRFASESTDNQQGNALRAVINGIFDDFQRAISHWQEEMRERSEVRQKLEQMGAGLIVVVFGRTNAGKSTLGNFLRGKQLREAPFDNAWKKGTIKPGPIRVIERAYSEEEKQEEGEWLTEGATETTREAQLFQLPGFLWLDTPGFGSTNDKSYGNLARKYVKRADLVIYLENSDNPGCRDITDQFVSILKEGRCALIAINRSDMMEQCRGEDGKRLWTEKTDENGIVTPVRVMKRVAKTAENRKQQEDYLVGVIGEKLGGKEVESISISTLLACEAVQNNDDTQFADSNMGALFSRILSLIADDDSFIALKSRDAVQNCIALIDRVIGEEESGPAEDRGKAPQEGEEKRISLENWDKRLGELEGRVKAADDDFNIDMETKNITASIMLKARPRLQKLVEDEEASREAGHKNSGRPRSIVREVGKGAPIPDEKGPEIDINPLLEQFAQEAGTLMEDKAKKLLKDLWLQEAIAIRQAFPSIERVTLHRRTERRTYEAYTTESCERDPDGVLEWVGSKIFGKTYHSTYLRKYMKEQIIDLGYNTQEVSAQLADRMEAELDAYVRAGLEQIRAECLTRGLRMIGERRAVLAHTEQELLALRGELESRLDGNTH